MLDALVAAVAILAAYLLGAVPFGFLIGKARGVDIRTQGSGNIGATNAGRVLGRQWGIICLVLDILKGLLPTLIFGLSMVPHEPAAVDLLNWVAVGAAAVLGHLFPVYLRFKGGKGVATTIGVALGIFPYFTIAMVVALVGYFAVRGLSGLVSLGSLTLAVVFPVALYVYAVHVTHMSLADCWPLLVVAVLLGLMIIVRHRENIRRLLGGKELRAVSKTD
ncbi:MAG: glycerol-3-phosphate 1-O-acyltransferase PlsY [Phycisphaerae bacterium]|nr:glycerol-3-phosphate 1-O-acyltransferase PlsY [Phycisphaerae bacterium]